jgi:hypothetical protein
MYLQFKEADELNRGVITESQLAQLIYRHRPIMQVERPCCIHPNPSLFYHTYLVMSFARLPISAPRVCLFVCLPACLPACLHFNLPFDPSNEMSTKSHTRSLIHLL